MAAEMSGLLDGRKRADRGKDRFLFFTVQMFFSAMTCIGAVLMLEHWDTFLGHHQSYVGRPAAVVFAGRMVHIWLKDL
jgi:hypothetical protein